MSHPLDSAPSIPAAFYRAAEEYPSRTLYSQAIVIEGGDNSVPRQWYSRSFSEARERVNKVAAYLIELGVQPGNRIALLSGSRPEWMECDIASLAVGAVVASVYQSLPADDVGYILYDSDSKIVFAENQEQVDKLLELASTPCHIPATEERPESSAQLKFKKIIAYEAVEPHELVIQYDEILSRPPAGPPNVLESLKRDDLAALVYTSGTTGPPKGVMQTHGNHLSNVRQAAEAQIFFDDSSILVVLPLAHSFARLMGFIGFLTPAELKFAGVADKKTSQLIPASITKDIRESDASIIPLVPRLLEKMEAGVIAKSKAGGLGAKILSLTLRVARKHYAAEKAGTALGLLDSMLYQGTAGIRAKIQHQLFGAELSCVISGGAKLSPSTAEFFDALGIEILEGYGLTETCVATNINRLGNKKIGTVGPRLADDIEMQIADDGEILFRGPNVSLGYLNRAAATKSSWDEDGWFHTGDLGSVDENGFLTIEGRKKDIIVTSYGKNIAPDPIEQMIKASPYVSQVVMLGDGKQYCIALLTLDETAVQAWAGKQGKTINGKLHEDPQVNDLLHREVEKVNEELASYETIKKIAIVPGDFTVENGFLTPTFKVKRRVVMKEYASVVDSLYNS